MARHFTIVKENNQAVRYPFKEWVRQNMTDWGADFLARATTSQFKGRFNQMKWPIVPGFDSVFVIRPDENGSTEYASTLLREVDAEIEEHEDAIEEAEEMTFGLERDMQNALRKNIQSLEKGLEIIDGGKERHTEAGFIDITARDKDGKIVIIELKAIPAKADVIAQTLAYMEAIHVEENKEVRGIIIASDFVDRVKVASRQIPNLELVQYSFQFTFNQIK